MVLMGPSNLIYPIILFYDRDIKWAIIIIVTLKVMCGPMCHQCPSATRKSFLSMLDALLNFYVHHQEWWVRVFWKEYFFCIFWGCLNTICRTNILSGICPEDSAAQVRAGFLEPKTLPNWQIYEYVDAWPTAAKNAWSWNWCPLDFKILLILFEVS